MQAVVPAALLGQNPVATPWDRIDDGRMQPTLLVVDDHMAFRSFACRMLTAAGFPVVGSVGGGGAALEAVLSLRPDAVLLDVQLPDGDGIAAECDGGISVCRGEHARGVCPRASPARGPVGLPCPPR